MATEESTVVPPVTPATTKKTPDAASPTLDALLSPQNTHFEGNLPKHESVAESDFNDIVLDEAKPPLHPQEKEPHRSLDKNSTRFNGSVLDEVKESEQAPTQEQEPGTEPSTPFDEDSTRFSTVPLSARESVGSSSSNAAIISPRNSLGDATSARSNDEDEFMTSTNKSTHRKTMSASSTHSASNAPFILQRLDLQNGDKRQSVDGQNRIQEEFVRKQAERQEEKENALNGAIDWDFWGAVISDYQKFASERPEELARAIERGIPHTLRGMMWQLMSVAKDPELEASYLKLLKETSPHEKAITRDLGRTFPHHDYFTDGQGIGQENLFNVLKAYSLYDPQVGYCQGLPFIVAILLLNMPDEEAFSLLVRLMYSYDLRGHFLPEMPKLQLRLFDRLIEEILPVLNVHFLRQGVKSSMFCSQWFLTLFSYRFPLDIVFRIYDNCLASGIEAIFGFSINLLHKNEDILLQLKFDEILAFMKNRVFDKYKISAEGEKEAYDVDEFVKDAVALRITPFMLDSYAHEYEELIRARDAHTLEMDKLRNSNRNLTAQVKDLENSLAQLNAEHVDVLNQLVMARLKKEEMEGELVRYKLLYAEAMHQNADALSSHRLSQNTLGSRASHSSKASKG
ncbi:hypothetical protein PLICRDRAFT_37239 [Plicaturopsis crispa FD-325 SS-3]|nr:hypothetical protein PLICRDRAFT_37239 [Plicaturopsis crispa FD-325 SS-3]